VSEGRSTRPLNAEAQAPLPRLRWPVRLLPLRRRCLRLLPLLRHCDLQLCVSERPRERPCPTVAGPAAAAARPASKQLWVHAGGRGQGRGGFDARCGDQAPPVPGQPGARRGRQAQQRELVPAAARVRVVPAEAVSAERRSSVARAAALRRPTAWPAAWPAAERDRG